MKKVALLVDAFRVWPRKRWFCDFLSTKYIYIEKLSNKVAKSIFDPKTWKNSLNPFKWRIYRFYRSITRGDIHCWSLSKKRRNRPKTAKPVSFTFALINDAASSTSNNAKSKQRSLFHKTWLRLIINRCYDDNHNNHKMIWRSSSVHPHLDYP